MMKFLRIPLILLVFILLSGCSYNMLIGSGVLTTNTRDSSGFTAITLEDCGELDITQGSVDSLTIQAEDNLMPFIKSEVKDARLTLGLRPNYQVNSIQNTLPVKYFVSVKNLREIVLSGAGKIITHGISANTLNVIETGPGSIRLDQLQAKELDLHLNGKGSTQVSGQVDLQTVEVGGPGEYDGDNLDSSYASVDVNGSGAATVWVKNALNVLLNGKGSTHYFGNPVLHVDNSGAGVVQAMGLK
ncbi:MAG: DUF2807 domain-containing protein [Anaerolineaceae bacterium]|nr:DUF2807 domain-containing protein [Anaerolineaceae bacterium]